MCGTSYGTSSFFFSILLLPNNAAMCSISSRMQRTVCQYQSCGNCQLDCTWAKLDTSYCIQTFSLNFLDPEHPSPKVREYSCMKLLRDRAHLSVCLNKFVRHIMNLLVAEGNYSLIMPMGHCYIQKILESKSIVSVQ